MAKKLNRGFIQIYTGNGKGKTTAAVGLAIRASAHRLKEDIMASFGINNVFNEKYSEYGVTNPAGNPRNFYPTPERNFIGEISCKF